MVPINENVIVNRWTAQDLLRLIIVTTMALCFLILVTGTLICVYCGKISPDLLGSIKGVGIGSGLLGFASIFYSVIKVALRR